MACVRPQPAESPARDFCVFARRRQNAPDYRWHERARHPAFDRDGQYLYFTASTNFGPTLFGLDMTSDEHDVTSTVYMAVLPNNIPSPLAAPSDEEKAPGAAVGDTADAGPGRGRARRSQRDALTPPKRSASTSIRSHSASFPCRCPPEITSSLTAGAPGSCLRRRSHRVPPGARRPVVLRSFGSI